MRTEYRIAIAIVVVLLLDVTDATSRTIRIPADKPYIQGGVDIAEPGDTVLVAPGTYSGFGNTYITFHSKSIALMSETGAEQTTILCDTTWPPHNQAMIFNSGEDSVARVIGFTFTGCAYGAITITEASPVIRDCIFTGICGQAIAVTGPARPRFVNCHIRDNYVTQTPSATYFGNQVRLLLDSCMFLNNSGPALGTVIYVSQSSADIRNCLFADNLTNSASIAIRADRSPIVFRGCSFVDNHSSFPGKDYRFAIYSTGADMLFYNCLIADNDGSIGLVYSSFDPRPVLALECSDIFGNSGGDWNDSIADQVGMNGNFSLDPMFCNAPLDDWHLQSNSPCLAANSPCGSLVGALDTGCVIVDVQEDQSDKLPAELLELTCFPNPFNAVTRIAFNLSRPERIDLSVCDLLGRRVAHLASGTRAAGPHVLNWTATDDYGRAVATGVYFVRLDIGTRTVSRKIVLLK